MNHQPPPNLHPHHIQQQQQHQEQIHHKQQPYIVHPPHLYNNQKSVEIVPTITPQQNDLSSYLHHHPGNSQAIYVNTITAFHGTPPQQQQQQQQQNQHQQLQQQQQTRSQAASNVIYVNTATVVPSSAGQHSHFGPNQPQQPPRHPGSAGHVPYSPAIHPGFHHHPLPPHPNLSDPRLQQQQQLQESQHHLQQQQQQQPQLNRPTNLFNNSSPPQKLRIGIFIFSFLLFRRPFFIEAGLLFFRARSFLQSTKYLG